MIQQIHFLVYIHNNWKRDHKDIFGHQHSLWGRNNLNVYRQLSGWRKCGMHTRWNIIWPQNECYTMNETRALSKWNEPIMNDKYCMIPLRWGIKSSQAHRIRKVEWYQPKDIRSKHLHMAICIAMEVGSQPGTRRMGEMKCI